MVVAAPRHGRGPGPVLRLLAVTGAVTASLLTLGAPHSQAAAAENRCWGGPVVTDYTGHTSRTSTCPTWTTAYLTWGPYDEPGHDALTGKMYAGDNWVVCQVRGRANPQLGGGTNHYWLYTQGDVGYRDNGWGWLPATAFSYGDNEKPVPGVAFCAAG